MNKKLIIGTVAAGFVLAGAIAAGAANNDSNDAKAAEANYSNQKMLTVQEVKEIALKHYDGIVEEIELDDPHYYEVEIETTHDDVDLKIHAYSGEVTVTDRDDDWNDWKDNDDLSNQTSKDGTEKTANASAQKSGTILTAEEAIKIAEEKTGGKVIELELDDDDNRLYYEIELISGGKDIEMEIDAVTGNVLDIEYDD